MNRGQKALESVYTENVGTAGWREECLYIREKEKRECGKNERIILIWTWEKKGVRTWHVLNFLRRA
jgi:hypothetical protein